MAESGMAESTLIITLQASACNKEGMLLLSSSIFSYTDY